MSSTELNLIVKDPELLLYVKFLLKYFTDNNYPTTEDPFSPDWEQECLENWVECAAGRYLTNYLQNVLQKGEPINHRHCVRDTIPKLIYFLGFTDNINAFPIDFQCLDIIRKGLPLYYLQQKFQPYQSYQHRIFHQTIPGGNTVFITFDKHTWYTMLYIDINVIHRESLHWKHNLPSTFRDKTPKISSSFRDINWLKKNDNDPDPWQPFVFRPKFPSTFQFLIPKNYDLENDNQQTN